MSETLDRDWNFADKPCPYSGSPCNLPERTHVHLTIDPDNPRTIVWYRDETQDEARRRDALERAAPFPIAWFVPLP